MLERRPGERREDRDRARGRELRRRGRRPAASSRAAAARDDDESRQEGARDDRAPPSAPSPSISGDESSPRCRSVGIHSIWMTPKTRARTSSGTARWMSVKAATSSERVADADDRQQHDRERRVRREPDRARAEAPEHDPDDERRREPRHPASESAASAPISAPTPKAEFRYRRRPRRCPRSSRAMTTRRTESRRRRASGGEQREENAQLASRATVGSRRASRT